MIYSIFKDDDSITFDTILCTTDKDAALKCIYFNKDRYAFLSCWDNNIEIFHYGRFEDTDFTYEEFVEYIEQKAKENGVELV